MGAYTRQIGGEGGALGGGGGHPRSRGSLGIVGVGGRRCRTDCWKGLVLPPGKRLLLPDLFGSGRESEVFGLRRASRAWSVAMCPGRLLAVAAGWLGGFGRNRVVHVRGVQAVRRPVALPQGREQTCACGTLGAGEYGVVGETPGVPGAVAG